MYEIIDNYKPFLPHLVTILRQKYEGKILLKSAHAYEIASAYFGYKSYAAAKSAKLNHEIGIFPPACKNSATYFQFFIEPHVEMAEGRINRLLPELSNYQTEKILSRLHNFYIYESDIYLGFAARLTRQLSNQYDQSQECFVGSVLMTDEDWKIAGEIVFRDDYIPQTFCSYSFIEPEVISNSKPLTVGDHLYQFNVDTIANIINFLDSSKINSLIES